MNAEIEEYFYLLREVCRADDSSLGTAYRQLRELLEHLCRTQMTDSSLQMTDRCRAKSPAYFPACL